MNGSVECKKLVVAINAWTPSFFNFLSRSVILVSSDMIISEPISSELEKLNLKVASHTSGINKLKDIDIYLVDTFGETKKFYQMAHSVFLGGSIANRGGQNPLEAARYGAKILHGPFISNFTDIYNLLKSYKISKKINSATQLSKEITFNKNVQSRFKIKNIGEKILKKTIKVLDKHIFDEFKKT